MMKPVPISFISLTQSSNSSDIRKLLSGLGYSVNEIFSLDNNESITPSGVAVIYLGTESSFKQSLLALLENLSEVPKFFILTGDALNWQTELLSHCNEFSIWPCDALELEFRLDRLSEYCRVDYTEHTASRVSEQLLDLNIIGKAPTFLRALSGIKKISLCDVPVLIEGETGTGKELVARAIHYLSERKQFPFIPVNCGALPDNLVENELFGHEKGAYTDAKSSYPGLVEQAEGGTLFLDEIEALSTKGQVSLLRFLQEYEYRPLGSKRSLNSNIRVIVAGNANLPKLVRNGEFREDLLYRLNVLSIEIPPLRQRKQDIELLAEYFMEQFRCQYDEPDKRLHVDTLNWLRAREWPGNVRELENLLHREFLLSDGNVIYLPRSNTAMACKTLDISPYAEENTSTKAFKQAKTEAIELFERTYLSELMKLSGGNVTSAARIAGKERRSLGKLLKKYGINKAAYI
jgi:DNA-binding NtrC family response regulator